MTILYEVERNAPKLNFFRLIDLYSTTQTRVIVSVLYTVPLSFSSVLLITCNAAICIKVSLTVCNLHVFFNKIRPKSLTEVEMKRRFPPL